MEQVSVNFVEKEFRKNMDVKRLFKNQIIVLLETFSPFASPASSASSRLIKQQSLMAAWSPSPSPSPLFQQHKRQIVSKQKSLSASTSRCLYKQQSLSASGRIHDEPLSHVHAIYKCSCFLPQIPGPCPRPPPPCPRVPGPALAVESVTAPPASFQNNIPAPATAPPTSVPR